MFKRFWWMLLAMLPVGAVVGLLFAAVITYVMPKMYESEAVIEVRPQMTPGSESQPAAMSPQSFGTLFEVIKSRKSLEKVVTNLELVKQWNVDRETAVQVLKRIVTTQNIRGTDLISIRVRHTNKVDARDIAAEVARAYKDYRAEIETSDAERRIYELNKTVRDLEDKVEERRKVLSTIIRVKGVGAQPSPADGGDPAKVAQATGETREEATKRAMDEQDYLDAKRELEESQELLKSMKLKQTSETIALKIGSNSVSIHEEPVIADKPISPNVTLNLTLGATLGFLLSPLIALPLMWLLNRRNRG